MNFELVRLIADIRAFSETKVIKFLMNNSYRALSVGIIASMGFAVELKDPHFDTQAIFLMNSLLHTDLKQLRHLLAELTSNQDQRKTLPQLPSLPTIVAITTKEAGMLI